MPLIHDCYFQNRSRNWPAQQAITINPCRGGVMWNCVMQGTQDVGQVGEGSLLVKYPAGVRDMDHGLDDGDARHQWHVELLHRRFARPSTSAHSPIVTIMAATWPATASLMDRGAVCMALLLAGAAGTWEIYDGILPLHVRQSEHVRSLLLVSGLEPGSLRATWVNNAFDPSDYGSLINLTLATTPVPARISCPWQPTCGHNGTAYVSDPIYIWNQTGPRAYEWGYQDEPSGCRTS